MRILCILVISVLICSPVFATNKHKAKHSVAQKHHATVKHTIASRRHHKAVKSYIPATALIKHNTPLVTNIDSAAHLPTKGLVDNLLMVLESELGKPYRLGSNGPYGFDCSGLIKFAFSFLGVALPRTASDIGQLGQMISLDDLHPGDLLFFSGRKPARNCIGHVGCVYKVDSGKIFMIHSSHEGVNIVDINNSDYYKKRLICAKRMFSADSCKNFGIKSKS